MRKNEDISLEALAIRVRQQMIKAGENGVSLAKKLKRSRQWLSMVLHPETLRSHLEDIGRALDAMEKEKKRG